MHESLDAFVVSQGEELLTGQTLDSNAHFLAGRLTELGLRVRGAITAGDRTDAIAEALRLATEQAAVVVCTGGLGPTGDDLTADAAGAAFGLPVALHGGALAQIEARYVAAGRPMAASNRRQAMLPEGCTVLENPVGTAPGFALSTAHGRLYCLPGVPFEMKEMWAQQVAPDLRARFALPSPERRLFRVLGQGESQLQDLLGDLPELHPGIELGFRAHMPENQVKLVAPPGHPGMDAAAEIVRARLGRDLFAEDESVELAGAIGELLVASGARLALAESCTGGWVAHLCVSEAGSSRWFDRGWVTYSNQAKQDELGVQGETLAQHGAVSEETALEMARGARARAGVDWAVAITGIAGPGGGSASRPVGTVVFSIAGPGVEHTRRLRLPASGRNQTRRFSSYIALDMLRRQLLRAADRRVGS